MDTKKNGLETFKHVGLRYLCMICEKNQEGRVFSHYKNDQQTLWMGQTRFESTAAKTQQVAVERPANQSLQ